MTAAYLILMSSVLGQYPYYYNPGYGYTYGAYPYYYGRALNYYDPLRYNRLSGASGFYTLAPPVIANPEVINFRKPAPSQPSQPPRTQQQPGTQTQTQTQPRTQPQPATTGVVTTVDEQKKQITLQLPVGTTTVAYGPTTHFLAADGNFPVIKPGNLISVNQNTITILRRSQP
jgi:hypothetical protein